MQHLQIQDNTHELENGQMPSLGKILPQVEEF